MKVGAKSSSHRCKCMQNCKQKNSCMCPFAEISVDNALLLCPFCYSPCLQVFDCSFWRQESECKIQTKIACAQNSPQFSVLQCELNLSSCAFCHILLFLLTFMCPWQRRGKKNSWCSLSSMFLSRKRKKEGSCFLLQVTALECEILKK